MMSCNTRRAGDLGVRCQVLGARCQDLIQCEFLAPFSKGGAEGGGFVKIAHC